MVGQRKPGYRNSTCLTTNYGLGAGMASRNRTTPLRRLRVAEQLDAAAGSRVWIRTAVGYLLPWRTLEQADNKCSRPSWIFLIFLGIGKREKLAHSKLCWIRKDSLLSAGQLSAESWTLGRTGQPGNRRRQIISQNVSTLSTQATQCPYSGVSPWTDCIVLAQS